MNVIKQVKSLGAVPLHFCLKTKGLRNIGIHALSPAFFHHKYQHYGKIPENYKNQDFHITISGFPKSGNVWVTSLIASCLDLQVTPRKGKCYINNTHQPLKQHDLFNKELLRGAVLLRDIRDIIVSLYHFSNTNHFKKTHGPHHIYSDLAEMYTDYFIPYFIENENVLEALPGPYVHYGWPVIRYERLWDNPEQELTRLFAIWDIDISPEKIREAIKLNSIDALRQGKGKPSEFEHVEKTHFRKGGYGNYKEAIPEHILKDIESRFGEYLTKWGYQI